MSLPFHSNHAAICDYAAFTDESGLAKDRYLVIGGVSCRASFAHELAKRVELVQRQLPFPDDSLQWKSITQSKLHKYRQLIQIFCELNGEQKLDFTCLVADKRNLIGDGEVSFQKMMHQTYRAILRKYGRPRLLRGFHAQRESPQAISEFRQIFNAATMKETRSPNIYLPLVQMEYMDPSRSHLHQMTDVVLGAVSWHWNRRRRGNASTVKGVVAEYLRCEGPLDRLDCASPWQCRHFHIWDFRLSPRA